MKRLLASLIGAVLLTFTLALACSDPLLQTYCTGIPTGGCPSDDPNTCVHDAGPDGDPGDPTCAAIYSHTPDCTWLLVQTCAHYQPHLHPTDAIPHEASARDARTDTGPSLRDAGFALPDGAAGGDGCVDLEAPDCPLATAVGCGPSCCGCETLYVCGSGGWNVWGECGDAGVVTKMAP